MPSPAEHRDPAHRGLFVSLINDAALFPPASRSMREALVDHAEHVGGSHADILGSFLVGVPMVTDLLHHLEDGSPTPRGVGLVARPGTTVPEIDAGLRALRRSEGVRLVSVDAGWSADWRNLELDDLPIHLEVGRERPHEVLDDIASAAPFVDVRAKFRTGATPTWAWPEAAEVARFVIACSERQLPFVLTGGLHHAVRGEYDVHGRREEQHGLLNVLLATHAAADGADEQLVRDLLELRDAKALAEVVAGWSAPDVAAVRSSLTAYGCCDVTDPIGELTELGVLAGH